MGTTIRNRHRPKGNGHQLIANTDSTQRAQYATRLNQRGRAVSRDRGTINKQTPKRINQGIKPILPHRGTFTGK